MSEQRVTSLAELSAALPVDLGRSAAVRITQEMVDVHAATTGDAQWIHNDPERARRESPFGGPVAQGFLLLSLRTVPVGSSVELHGTLAEVRSRGDGSAVLAVDAELHVVADDDPGTTGKGPAVVARWLFLAVPA